MNHDLSLVSNSDSSDSSYTCSGLTVLIQNIYSRLKGHILGHLSPQARNIYLVAAEPGCDPWCEPLDSEFDLEPPCPYHTHCGCNWTDSYFEIDKNYFVYPTGPKAEYLSGALCPPVQAPIPVSLVLSQVTQSDPDSICFGSVQVQPNPVHPFSGYPKFNFCRHQHCCSCEPFLKIEVSRTCILIDPEPDFHCWVQFYLKEHQLKC